MVTEGEIARFEQFLLLLPCFQKAVCCRGVRKRLYEGKGWVWPEFSYFHNFSTLLKKWNLDYRFSIFWQDDFKSIYFRLIECRNNFIGFECKEWIDVSCMPYHHKLSQLNCLKPWKGNSSSSITNHACRMHTATRTLLNIGPSCNWLTRYKLKTRNNGWTHYKWNNNYWIKVKTFWKNYEQFLHLPHFFQKLSAVVASEKVTVWGKRNEE